MHVSLKVKEEKMAVISDPELYRTTEKHWGHHPLTGYATGFEVWYNNGSFNNGYHTSIFWGLIQGMPMVDLRICDPSGKLVVESTQMFDPSEWVASTETLDIRLGEQNYYRGKSSAFTHCIHDGDNGAELVFETLTQPTLGELPDGIVVGWENTPSTPTFFSWFFRPRCKVTGKLIVAGEEIPVTGEGLGEHEYSTGNFLDTFQYWYFGCLPIGQHTLVFMEGHLAESLGYQKVKWLWDWKGEKFYEHNRYCDYFIEASDLQLDPETEKSFPGKMVIFFEHSRIKGTVTCTHKTTMQQMLYPGIERKVLYHNGVYDCHAKMEIDGEKIETDFTRLLETAI
jgi:hypothetical protein